MNRHVGASFTLSVLIVVFFAVILYEPDHSHPASEAAALDPASPTTADLPPPTPDLPLIEASSEPLLEAAHVPPVQPAPVKVLLSQKTTSPNRIPNLLPSEPPPMTQVISRKQAAPPTSHSAFTQVGEGESLSDVALRIYGTPEATRTLWRANRDIIAHLETPLVAGILLRTP